MKLWHCRDFVKNHDSNLACDWQKPFSGMMKSKMMHTFCLISLTGGNNFFSSLWNGVQKIGFRVWNGVKVSKLWRYNPTQTMGDLYPFRVKRSSNLIGTNRRCSLSWLYLRLGMYECFVWYNQASNTEEYLDPSERERQEQEWRAANKTLHEDAARLGGSGTRPPILLHFNSLPRT